MAVNVLIRFGLSEAQDSWRILEGVPALWKLVIQHRLVCGSLASKAATACHRWLYRRGAYCQQMLLLGHDFAPPIGPKNHNLWVDRFQGADQITGFS